MPVKKIRMPQKACGNSIFDKVETLSIGQHSAFCVQVRSITKFAGGYRSWALGFVSMLMDISSELIHSLLPVFMTTVLGASMATIGLLEGVAEGTAAVTKVFSGSLSATTWGSASCSPCLVTGSGRSRSRSSRWLPPSAGCLPRASSTGSAKAFAVRRAMRWWRTSRRPSCAGGLRAAPIAGCRRRFPRPAARRGVHGVARERHPNRAMGCGRPGLPRRSAARRRRSRAPGARTPAVPCAGRSF